MIDVMKMFKARLWMKRNVLFLYSWHAYVGYELDLFKAFERGVKVADVADAYQIDEILLNQWTNVGVSIGHLKPMSRKRYKTEAMWKLPRPKAESSSGVILKEMMELHIPSLLTYPDMMRNRNCNHFDSEKHADTVAQTSHENLHPLPHKGQMEQWGDDANFEFLGIQKIIQEGSW
ncbi:hypothetical protein [Paenisporosarcina sp. OV554]|uniref:hypothetical protein n=1 Tax=Paenisporosarcina sp. OV554 TaxID=2135694 RepID=UPI000D3871BC|nr:hypothetical protein [Paenisporosarcina sp. OV554]PUB08469.1 hypothetical protein C8K15_1313 [Paenisporosarcina sp. OV554]